MDANGRFQPLSFIGPNAYASGFPETVSSYYTWNTPTSGSSSPEPAPTFSSGVVVISGGTTVSSASTISTYMLTNADMLVGESGKANSIVVNNSGRMMVGSGGSADNLQVSSGGQLYLYSGGTLGASNGIYSGGTIKMSGGQVSRLNATSAIVELSGGAVESCDITDCMATIGSGASVNNLGATGQVTIDGGEAQASITDLLNAGVIVKNGTISPNNDTFYLSALTLSSGGTAVEANVIYFAEISGGGIMSGGTVYGTATVQGSVNSVTIRGYYPGSGTGVGAMTLLSGATVNNLKLGAGSAPYGISSSHYVRGDLYVSDGGVVSGVEMVSLGNIDGYESRPTLHVYSGGAAYNVISSGLSIIVDQGGLITYA